MRTDVVGAAERLDLLVDKLGEDIVAAAKAVAAGLDDIPAGSVTDATARITAALPKLPAAKKRHVLSAFLLRDPDGEVVDRKGKPEPDLELRDQESVPLTASIDGHLGVQIDARAASNSTAASRRARLPEKPRCRRTGVPVGAVLGEMWPRDALSRAQDPLLPGREKRRRVPGDRGISVTFGPFRRSRDEIPHGPPRPRKREPPP